VTENSDASSNNLKYSKSVEKVPRDRRPTLVGGHIPIITA